MTETEKLALLLETVEHYARAKNENADYKDESLYRYGSRARDALAKITKARQTRSVYSELILYLGEYSQMRKTIEECAELIAALSRYLNSEQEAQKRGGMIALDDAICEELADVQICLEQMKLVFSPVKINNFYVEKYSRLIKKVGELNGNDAEN